MDVAMVVHVCCKRPFQMFHLFFQTYVASVLIWMLHMFHIYVASVYVRNVSSVSVLCCNKCFHVASCKCFIWMLHMFHTHVINVCFKYFNVSVLCRNKCFHVASCKCFIWMLHVFHTYVASICSKCFICFRRMLYLSVSCFRGMFRE